MKQVINNRNSSGYKDSSNCYLNINDKHYIQWIDKSCSTETEWANIISDLQANNISYVIRTINKQFKRLYKEVIK